MKNRKGYQNKLPMFILSSYYFTSAAFPIISNIKSKTDMKPNFICKTKSNFVAIYSILLVYYYSP